MSGRTVLILGGGVGGVVAASRLRQLLDPADRVVLVERGDRHVFWPSLLWVATGTRRVADIQRPYASLAERGIDVRQGEVTALDPERRTVTVAGAELHGDAVVVALGADLVPEAVPGLPEAGINLYSTAGAEQLHATVRGIAAGRVVILVAAVPFKCPAAPYEAAMLVEHQLRRRRVRDQVDVAIYAAEPAPLPVAGPQVSQAVTAMLAQRGITYHPNHNVSHVEPSERRVHFTEGDPVGFDVLAAVPPHAAPEVIRRSPLAGASGWAAVDPASCETRFENVFAIGDVATIPLAMGKPLPKAGVFASAQAEAVAATVAARLRGRGGPRTFDGRGECFIETGGGLAGFARGNFFAQPTPAVQVFRPGRHWHAAKVALEKAWWHSWF